MRRKDLGSFSRACCPSVAHAEALEVRFLVLAEIVLGAGILTGMALGYLDSGQLCRSTTRRSSCSWHSR